MLGIILVVVTNYVMSSIGMLLTASILFAGILVFNIPDGVQKKWIL